MAAGLGGGGFAQASQRRPNVRYLLHAVIKELKGSVPLVDEGAIFYELHEHLSLHQLSVELLVGSLTRFLKAWKAKKHTWPQ